MSGDPERLLQEQRRRAESQRELQSKSTLEVVEMERSGVPLPEWQRWLVNGLAVIGALTLVYIAFNLIFS